MSEDKLLDPVSILANISEYYNERGQDYMSRIIENTDDPDVGRYNHNWCTVIMFRAMMIEVNMLSARIVELEHKLNYIKEKHHDPEEEVREQDGFEDTRYGAGSDKPEDSPE